MGMDVFGENPTGEEGEYFRRRVQRWHPLADFIEEACPEEAAACAYWHSNDGDGLDAAGALALADRLDALVADGTARRWIEDYGRRPTASKGTPGLRGVGMMLEADIVYSLDVDDIRAFAAFARASGGFRIT